MYQNTLDYNLLSKAGVEQGTVAPLIQKMVEQFINAQPSSSMHCNNQILIDCTKYSTDSIDQLFAVIKQSHYKIKKQLNPDILYLHSSKNGEDVFQYGRKLFIDCKFVFNDESTLPLFMGNTVFKLTKKQLNKLQHLLNGNIKRTGRDKSTKQSHIDDKKRTQKTNLKKKVEFDEQDKHWHRTNVALPGVKCLDCTGRVIVYTGTGAKKNSKRFFCNDCKCEALSNDINFSCLKCSKKVNVSVLPLSVIEHKDRKSVV